uniref:Uncharacterized protein n=1 Tax=Siphoviridae sp. ctkKt3 TaxID=2825642 RepID=A0A8S5UZ17_9CAUD|nr:MAG TPA: hypothetical protein [Siphoviridae sp. ctkKt3]
MDSFSFFLLISFSPFLLMILLYIKFNLMSIL